MPQELRRGISPRRGAKKRPDLPSKRWAVMRTDRVLFGAEGEHGIHGGSSARRQVAGNESNSEKKQACRHDSGQIGWREAEEHAGDEPSRSEAGGNPQRDSEESQRQRLAQNHPANTSLLRAQRDADADFAGAALGPKARTNVLSDSITMRKKALGEASADDGDVRMLLIVGQLKVATTQQVDAEGVEETGPSCYSDRHHMETSVRIL